MKYLPHQISKASEVLNTLRKYKVAYINGKPRSGKTATAIKVAEDTKLGRWLVLTKKSAISGWLKFIEDEELAVTKTYTVTNYEQVGSKGKLKLNPSDYDGIILDEAHNFGAIPKPSGRVKLARLLCYHKPLILLSGTPVVEGATKIYHQLWITKYSIFKHRNFYDFFRTYGIPYYTKAGGRDIQQYDKSKPELLAEIDTITTYISQEDAGINLQVEDKLHYVTLSDKHKALYNELQEHQIVTLPSGEELVCDSTMKLRTALHMLESGVCKIDTDYYELGYYNKIQYILDTFGDSASVGIMSHFIGEHRLLYQMFTKAQIYSSNAHAEGVDLSHLKHFIILSSDYSGAKFVQRRERIANINGSNTLTVHHILVKGAISEQVYKAVSKKLDFNNKVFSRSAIS